MFVSRSYPHLVGRPLVFHPFPTSSCARSLHLLHSGCTGLLSGPGGHHAPPFLKALTHAFLLLGLLFPPPRHSWLKWHFLIDAFPDHTLKMVPLCSSSITQFFFFIELPSSVTHLCINLFNTYLPPRLEAPSGEPCLLCSLLYPQCPASCLADSKNSALLEWITFQLLDY